MRVGIDGHYLEEGYGGIQTFLIGFLKNIFKIDKKNKYFLFFKSKVESLDDFAKGIKPENFFKKKYQKNLIQKLSWLVWFNFILPRHLKKFKIDIFFSPNHFLPLFKKVKKEIILIHDFAFKINPQWKNFSYKLYSKIFQKRSLQRADLVIAISKSSRNDLLKYYFFEGLEEKTKVIYGGVQENFFSREKNEKKVIEIKKKYLLPENFILSVGKIEARKNPEMLIEVFEELKEILKDFKLVIVGKNEKKEILKKIKKVKDIYHFENVNSDDFPYFYNLAKIFFLPSFYEGFCFPVLEALKSGLPVVSSNTGALKEIIASGGLIFLPQEKIKFKQAILKLIFDKNFYFKMKERAQKRAKNFSFKKTVQDFLKNLENLKEK